MFTAEMIPDFNEKTVAGLLCWWNAMLDMDLYIHPEDDPANIVNIETGSRSLDDNACKKISDIYDEMISVVGYEETYDAGMTAFMNRRGWVCNPAGDGWVETETRNTDTSWCHRAADSSRYAPNPSHYLLP